MRGAVVIDSQYLTDLLEQIERVAGWVEHAAAISDSLATGQFLGQKTSAQIAANHEFIDQGLSCVLDVYGTELRSTVELFRLCNADELNAG
jgi:hypothetical protein